MSKPTLEAVKEEVERLGPSVRGAEDDSSYRTAVVLLSAALVEGPDINGLAAFTGYSRDFIAAIALRMRVSGLWEDDFVNAQHWYRDDSYNPAGFWVDVLVAEGLVLAQRLENGQFIYRIRE